MITALQDSCINVLFAHHMPNKSPVLRRIMDVFSCLILSVCCFPLQLIQTISAVDTDEPLVGHKFVFSISATNPNFTIVDKDGRIKFRSQHTFSDICTRNTETETLSRWNFLQLQLLFFLDGIFNIKLL